MFFPAIAKQGPYISAITQATILELVYSVLPGLIRHSHFLLPQPIIFLIAAKRTDGKK